MADEFTLTGHSVRVVGTAKQPLFEALDVSDYDEADVVLGFLAVEGAAPSVTVRILTSMTNTTESGWVIAHTFPPVTVSDTFEKANLSQFLKFIRWEVSAFAGNAATFSIGGMLRVWG